MPSDFFFFLFFLSLYIYIFSSSFYLCKLGNLTLGLGSFSNILSLQRDLFSGFAINALIESSKSLSMFYNQSNVFASALRKAQMEVMFCWTTFTLSFYMWHGSSNCVCRCLGPQRTSVSSSSRMSRPGGTPRASCSPGIWQLCR